MAIPVVEATLQSAATTGNGTPVQLNGRATDIVVYIEGSAGVSAGAVTLEEAPTSDYAGTWAPIGSAVTVVASSVLATHISGAYMAIRARLSTNITGGTVTVRLVGVSI